jgi:periplasmic nitrate reductase NapD
MIYSACQPKNLLADNIANSNGGLSMVISGIYIETIPGTVSTAAVHLAEMKGVEVHHIEDERKIVITLETDTVDQSYRTAELFKEIAGVLAICLVYTNFAEEPFYMEAAAFQ